MDCGDDILRRAFRMAIISIPFAYVLGWAALIVLVVPPILLLGMDWARRPGDVAASPFAFCLPGFRESLRKRYFIAAVLMGLGASVFVLALALYVRFRQGSVVAVDAVTVCLHMAAAFAVGMVIALAMGTLRFVLSKLAWNLVMLLSIPLFLLAVVALPALIEYCFVGIPLCVVACAFVWRRLGDMRRVKRGHRMIVEDALERRAQVGVTRTASPGVERLFRWSMEHRNLNARTYIWGSLYRAFGLAFSYWKWVLASIVVAALILGYAGPWLADVAFASLGLAAMAVHLPVAFDGTLLPMGPRQRCHATLAVAVAASLLLVGVAAIVTIFTWLFSAFLPTLDGSTCAGVPPWTICLPGLVTPWVLGCRLLGHKHPRIANLLAPAAIALVIAGIWLLGVVRIAWPRPAGTMVLVVALAGGWPFFLLALRDACTRVSVIEPPSGKAGRSLSL